MTSSRRFPRARNRFMPLPSLTGRTYVVTGASAGIGLCTATALAQAGAHVIAAVRDPDRGRAALAHLGEGVEVARLDVSSLDSVRSFADGVEAIDVLINNAGVMGLAESRSADGFELQLATNHLGHFALANLLLPRIRDRVVVVGSQAHHSAELDLANLNLEHGAYKPYLAYANSKLANLLFMHELQARLSAAGSDVRAVGAHPGYTATKLMRTTSSGPFNALAAVGNSFVGMSPEGGANCVLHAATKDLPGDTYIGPRGPFQMRGAPTTVGRSRAAGDSALAQELWLRSEAMTGVGFGL